jgi:hypothetical protein
LENALRNWSALTAGDVIIINYNKKYESTHLSLLNFTFSASLTNDPFDRNYEINVLEVKPDTASHAISIIEADVMVDFAPSQEQLKKGTCHTFALGTSHTRFSETEVLRFTLCAR